MMYAWSRLVIDPIIFGNNLPLAFRRINPALISFSTIFSIGAFTLSRGVATDFPTLPALRKEVDFLSWKISAPR